MHPELFSKVIWSFRALHASVLLLIGQISTSLTMGAWQPCKERHKGRMKVLEKKVPQFVAVKR